MSVSLCETWFENPSQKKKIIEHLVRTEQSVDETKLNAGLSAVEVTFDLNDKEKQSQVSLLTSRTYYTTRLACITCKST